MCLVSWTLGDGMGRSSFLEMFSWGALGMGWPQKGNIIYLFGTSLALQIEGMRAFPIHGTRCRLLHLSRVPPLLRMASELSSAAAPLLLHTTAGLIPSLLCARPGSTCPSGTLLLCQAWPRWPRPHCVCELAAPGWLGEQPHVTARLLGTRARGRWADTMACNWSTRRGRRDPVMQRCYNKEKLWAARLEEEDAHERMTCVWQGKYSIHLILLHPSYQTKR